MDVDELSLFDLSNQKVWEPVGGQSVFPRYFVNAATTPPSSGGLRGTNFVANKTRVISKIAMSCGSTASATITLAKYGLYSIDRVTGDATLIGSTPNTTTILNATNTVFSINLTTPVEISAGNLYSVALILVGTTMPTPHAFIAPNGVVSGVQSTKCAWVFVGQADLPTTITAANMSPDGFSIYAEVLTG